MLKARDIMTREVLTVTPEMPVEQLADLLWEHRISGAPVLDESGKLVAVATESDLIDQTKKVHIPTVAAILDSIIVLENPHKLDEEIRKMAGSRVKDIATRKLVTVTTEAPLDEIASIMARQRVHTLPVVDAEGKLVGVIGKSDIIKTYIKK
ncbi:MAG: CBS domain-containing protein [Desulfobacteraceae bacterium]|nr:CBS domain-containing protein [Desulfobacteraceae bacterium]